MTSMLSFISPLTISSGMISSSTAQAYSISEPFWSAASSYAKGDIVYQTSMTRRYECLIAGVDAGPPEDTPLRWYDLGSTDQMTMFDGEVSTPSIADGALTVVLLPGAFNSIYMAGLSGSGLSVTVKDEPGGTIVYSYSGDLEGSEPADWYEHFYDPFIQRTDFYIAGLDAYASCEVTIDITAPSAIASCGMCVFGNLTSLGETLQGVTVEPKSYNRIIADERGKTSIRRGKSARDMSVNARVSVDESDYVVDQLTSVMGVPCVWIATDSVRLQALRGFGLGNGKMTYEGTQYAHLSFTMQGMI